MRRLHVLKSRWKFGICFSWNVYAVHFEHWIEDLFLPQTKRGLTETVGFGGDADFKNTLVPMWALYALKYKTLVPMQCALYTLNWRPISSPNETGTDWTWCRLQKDFGPNVSTLCIKIEDFGTNAMCTLYIELKTYFFPKWNGDWLKLLALAVMPTDIFIKSLRLVKSLYIREEEMSGGNQFIDCQTSAALFLILIT